MSCRHLPQGQLLHCGEISKWMQSHTTIGKGRLSKCVLCLSLSTSLSLFSVLLSLISAPPETLSLSRAHSLILSRAWPPDSRVAYSHKKSIFFYFEANPVFNIELVKSNEQNTNVQVQGLASTFNPMNSQPLLSRDCNALSATLTHRNLPFL